MWLESEIGRGSTFHFTANFAVSNQPRGRVQLPETETLHDLAVLVVDDNATNRRILHETLLRWNMRPVLAESGGQALEIMHQHADAGDRFALILLDAQMPGMDGFALARQIHQDPMLAGPRIMMLSSLDLKSLSPELRETGHYVTKPVTRPTLLKAIFQVLEEGSAKPPEVSRSIPRRATIERSLHVLLAEDNAVNQKVVARLLQKQGHSVVMSSNGQEALSAYAREAFDLVLMDVQMPEMNGYESTQPIRTQEQQTGHHVPIIALTAHALKGDREICLQAGMDDYPGKPVHLQELIGVLEHWGKRASEHALENNVLPRV